MTKRLIQVGVSLLVLIIIGVIVYMKSNPPLVSGGLTWNPNNKTFQLIEIQNIGFTDIVLKQVLVNDSEEPKKVELGVSRSGHMVQGGGLESDPNISFHSINEHKIHPVFSPADNKKFNDNNDRENIRHYGIRIQHDKPIQLITIKYNYIQIPFTLKKNVSIQE